MLLAELIANFLANKWRQVNREINKHRNCAANVVEILCTLLVKLFNSDPLGNVKEVIDMKLSRILLASTFDENVREAIFL